MAAPGKIVGMTKAAAVTSAAVPFVPFATFCSKPLRLLLWAKRMAFGVAIR